MPEVIYISTIVVKAAAILCLVHIAMVDFSTRKIRNQALAYLLVIALSLSLLQYFRLGSGFPFLVQLAAGGLVFLVLIVFWAVGKVGAGDVKLLAIVPLVVGMEGSLTFVIALLAFTFATYWIMKYPTVLPERWLRSYVVHLSESGRVPFGVPISAAAIVAILLPASLVLQAWEANTPASPTITPLNFEELVAKP